MFHYYETIQNTKGDSLIGYFVRVIDPVTGDAVTMASDKGGTPIATVSGVANKCKTDKTGTADFYVPGGEYHLDIYQPDAATFIRRVTNIPMFAAPTLAVGTVTTGTPGSSVVISNVGDPMAAVLNITIPAGQPGTNGTNGSNGSNGANGADGTTGNNYFGYGVPANNQYVNGDTYTDLNTGLVYGQKTGGKWPLGTTVDVNAATPSRTRVDLRIPNATIPANHINCTRNSTSTDMMPYDVYTYSYNSFAINTPVLKPGKGVIGTGARAQQLLAAPTVPANETVTVPVGVVCVTAWGPGGSTYTSAAGTAVGTGFGALAGNAGVAQYITITTAGTITLTPAGGIAKANVQYNPSLPSATEAVPFIPTQSIREADLLVMGSTLLPVFQSTQGYFLMGISDTIIRSYGSPPTFLGLNNSPTIFPTSLTGINLLDAGGGATPFTLGSGSLATSVTIGLTWDATATVTIGGGDKLEVSRGFRLNNNVAVTAGSLLGSKTTGNASGAQGASACLGWYEYGTDARLSDEALYAAYTSFKLPVLSDILKNYAGASQFRKFLTAYRQCQAGIIDHVRVADFGSSHHAGTNAVQVNIRASGPTAQMIADLKTEGVYPVNDDFFGGMQGLSWTGGTNQYDSRLAYAGGTPTGFGNQNGVQVIRIPSGATLTFTPALNSAQFRLMYYTGSGYGSIEVSKDGGTTAIVPVEGGSATIVTNAAASYQVRNFTATLGANAWTIKAVGAAVDISFGYAFDPTAKQIVFGNFACYGYTAAGLSLDASPESSVLGPLKQYAPHLCFGCSDNTNSMSPQLSYSTYSTGVAAILVAEQLTADVILFTDPPSDLSFVTQATQDTIFNYGRSLGWQNGLPMFDYAGWAQTYLRQSVAGFYGVDTKHLEKRAVKRTKSNPQKALFKQIMALA